MNDLNFNITPSAPSRPKNILCVVVGYRGTSKGRQSFKIEGLTNPDFRYWDKKSRRFSDGTETANLNNPILDNISALCESLLNNSLIKTPAQFIAALAEGTAPDDVLTLGDFLNTVITEMREGKNNKRPSRNYQVYINLLHKLEREGELIHRPMADIDNKCFIQFSNFILSLSDAEGRSNYSNIMKLFKQLHKKAYERELNDHVLRFKYSDAAPIGNDADKLPALTLKHMQSFRDFDMSLIPEQGARTRFYNELYRDFCLFLYETKSRPVDVMRAHSRDLVATRGKKYWKYLPEKKKNSKQRNKVVYVELTDAALRIIDKYKGVNSLGYILPFSLNNHERDFNDAKSWNTWNNAKSRTHEMINEWLKLVAKTLKFDINVTLYSFRRSALTHACAKKGANTLFIALEAGTSTKMLEQHYVSTTSAIM